MPLKTKLKWQVRKILLAKSRKPGTWLTFQELLNIVQYAAMGLALAGMKSATDASLTTSPEPQRLGSAQWNGYRWATVLGACDNADGDRTKLLFAPDTSLTRQVVEEAARLAGGGDSDGDASCAVEGFGSAAQLLSAFESTESLHHTAAAGVMFNGDTAAGLGNYTLALSRDLVSSDESRKRGFEWPSQLAATRQAYAGHNDGDTEWLSSGFVTLQWAIDRGIGAAAGGGDVAAAAAAGYELGVSRFPLQPFSSAYGAGNADLLAFLLPLFSVMPPFVVAMLLIQFMLNEKCYQLVEGMRMMGMRYSTYYGAWLLVYGAIMLLAASVQTAALCAMGWFPRSDCFLLFVTLLLSGLACLAFTFVMVASSKGDANDPEKAKQAGQSGSFFWLMRWASSRPSTSPAPTPPSSRPCACSRTSPRRTA